MTRTEYQDMSAGYSPLRLATPSGTGDETQPCVNCGQPVMFNDYYGHWMHTNGESVPRYCREVTK